MRVLLMLPLLALATIVASAAPAAEEVEPRIASSVALIASPVAGREHTARRNQTLLMFEARPVLAVTLAQPIPHSLSSQFGARSDVPFNIGRRLYGWPERPGLYCDLLRSRGLTTSAACLLDSDMDGDFDEGLRLDFHSRHADLLGVTPNGKIIGVNFTKVRVPLPDPIAYTPAAPARDVSGKLLLHWKRLRDKASQRDIVQLWISTAETTTGTKGLSEKVLTFDPANVPGDLEFYGIRLRIHRFDTDGRMRFTVLGMIDGVPIPLLFHPDTSRTFIFL